MDDVKKKVSLQTPWGVGQLRVFKGETATEISNNPAKRTRCRACGLKLKEEEQTLCYFCAADVHSE